MDGSFSNSIYRMPALGMLGPLGCGIMVALWEDMVLALRVFCVVLGVASVGLGVMFYPLWKNLSVFALLFFTGWMLMTGERASTEFPDSTTQYQVPLSKHLFRRTMPTGSSEVQAELQIELQSRQLTAMLLLISDPVEKGERLRCDVMVVAEMPGITGVEIDEENKIEIEVDDKVVYKGVTKDGDLWRGRLMQVYVPMDERSLGLETGDCICARFVPREPANFSDDFDYASYLRGKGFTAVAYVSSNSWSVCEGEERAENSFEAKGERAVNLVKTKREKREETSFEANEERAENTLEAKREGRAENTIEAKGEWTRPSVVEAIPRGWRMRIGAERCRKRLVQVYADYGISGDALALVSALSLGKKDLMDSETRERYASAGVSHVLAVSGMHVGIVYGFVNGVVGLLWWGIGYPIIGYPIKRLMRKRYARLLRQGICPKSGYWLWPMTAGIIARQVTVVAVLWCYAFITGLPASVVRSVTMFTLSAGAICLSRSSQTWNNLFLTAFFMLCFKPSYLLDVGFQMSFMAVIAILLFLPCFQRLLGIKQQDDMLSLFVGGVTGSGTFEPQNGGFIKRLLRIVWHYMLTSLLISIAAQLGTTPLSVYYFHRFPQWFLLSNLVLVPTAVVLTWAALAFQCLAAIPFVPEIIVSKAAVLLSYMLNFFTGFAFSIESLPGAIVDGLLPTIGEILAAYLLIGTIFYFLQKKAYLYRLENILRFIRGMKYSKFMKNR